jgi:hypothetical protein
LLGIAVHFDDGVVQIDAYWTVDPVHQRRVLGQPGQQAAGHGVELADMTEGELPQERPQRRGRIRAIEHGAHRAVPQQSHVINAVGPGDHARDQAAHLRPGVGALVGRHTQMLIGQHGQAALLGQRGHRDQPSARHKIGVIKAC